MKLREKIEKLRNIHWQRFASFVGLGHLDTSSVFFIDPFVPNITLDKSGVHTLFFDETVGDVNFSVTFVVPEVRFYVVGLCTVGGVCRRRQQVSFSVFHAAPQCTSWIVVRSVVREGGDFAFHGMVSIDSSAVGTQTHVENRNLTVGCDTRVLSEPFLMIGTAEGVRCSHAATTGGVPSSMLLYMLARGLTKDAATNLFAEGFLGMIKKYNDR